MNKAFDGMRHYSFSYDGFSFTAVFSFSQLNAVVKQCSIVIGLVKKLWILRTSVFVRKHKPIHILSYYQRNSLYIPLLPCRCIP